MKLRGIVLVLMAGLVSVTLSTWAQEADDPGVEDVGARSAGDRGHSPLLQDTESSPKNSSTPGGESPSDYQASEQISEDLSVSFPVDI